MKKTLAVFVVVILAVGVVMAKETAKAGIVAGEKPSEIVWSEPAIQEGSTCVQGVIKTVQGNLQIQLKLSEKNVTQLVLLENRGSAELRYREVKLLILPNEKSGLVTIYKEKVPLTNELVLPELQKIAVVTANDLQSGLTLGREKLP